MPDLSVLTCLGCGGPIPPPTTRRRRTKYCSDVCQRRTNFRAYEERLAHRLSTDGWPLPPRLRSYL